MGKANGTMYIDIKNESEMDIYNQENNKMLSLVCHAGLKDASTAEKYSMS